MSKFVLKFIKSKFILEKAIGVVVGGVLGAGISRLAAHSYITDMKDAYYNEELKKAHRVVMGRRSDEILSNILECDVLKAALHNTKYKPRGSVLIYIPLAEKDEEKREREEADPDTPVDLPEVEDKKDIPNELSVDSEVVKRGTVHDYVVGS